MNTDYIYNDKDVELIVRDLKATLFDILIRNERQIETLENTIVAEKEVKREKKLRDLWAKYNSARKATVNAADSLSESIKALDVCSYGFEEIMRRLSDARRKAPMMEEGLHAVDKNPKDNVQVVDEQEAIQEVHVESQPQPAPAVEEVKTEEQAAPVQAEQTAEDPIVEAAVEEKEEEKPAEPAQVEQPAAEATTEVKEEAATEQPAQAEQPVTEATAEVKEEAATEQPAQVEQPVAEATVEVKEEAATEQPAQAEQPAAEAAVEVKEEEKPVEPAQVEQPAAETPEVQAETVPADGNMEATNVSNGISLEETTSEASEEPQIVSSTEASEEPVMVSTEEAPQIVQSEVVSSEEPVMEAAVETPEEASAQVVEGESNSEAPAMEATTEVQAEGETVEASTQEAAGLSIPGVVIAPPEESQVTDVNAMMNPETPSEITPVAEVSPAVQLPMENEEVSVDDSYDPAHGSEEGATEAVQAEIPAESTQSSMPKIVFFKDYAHDDKAILITNNQGIKLRSSKETQRALVKSKASSLEENVTEQQLQEMISQLTSLYEQGKVEEAEAMSEQISILSKKLKQSSERTQNSVEETEDNGYSKTLKQAA